MVDLSFWGSGRERDPNGTVLSHSGCSPFVPFSRACVPTGGAWIAWLACNLRLVMVGKFCIFGCCVSHRGRPLLPGSDPLISLGDVISPIAVLVSGSPLDFV